MKNPYFWLAISIVLYAYGEYLSKVWTFRPTILFTCWVIFIYALGAAAWLPAIYQKNQISIMGTIWLLLATISTIFVGTVMFQENLSSLQWWGIVLALISCLLLAG